MMMHFFKGGVLFVRKSLYDGDLNLHHLINFSIQELVAMGIDEI